MVLLNRRKIQPKEIGQSADSFSETPWVIKESSERINDYNSDLKKLDFYKRDIFTCEISGKDGLSYFKALKSEEQHREKVRYLLPKELRKAIANFANFSPIRKVGHLVESAFQRFSNRFFIGDTVCLKTIQKNALITYKEGEPNLVESPTIENNVTLFLVKDVFQSNGMMESEKGEISAPKLSLYLITECLNRESKGAALIVGQNEIKRPESHFSKFIIACFLNEILIKVSNKEHAPWRVKQEYIERYDVNPKCSPNMIDYLPDRMNSSSSELYTPLTIPPESDVEPADWKETSETSETSLSKIKAIDDEISVSFDHIYDNVNSLAYNDLKGTVDDKELPFTGPSIPFENISYLDSSLEYKNIDQKWFKECSQFPTERLLVVYQFLSFFGRFIGLSHFNFDQFLTTIKCTSPEALVDEYVKINFLKTYNSKGSFTNEKPRNEIYNQVTSSNVSQREKANVFNADESQRIPSNFTRNQKMRKFITDKSTEFVMYSIFKGKPLKNDDMEFQSYEKGNILYIDIVCSLMCLMTDNEPDWNCNLMDNWTEEKRKEEGNKTEIDIAIEKCLNYGDTSWVKLLHNKNFSNGNWLICLLGILQQNTHMIAYSDVAKCITKKILPLSMNFVNLGDELWDNFRKRLSIKDKIDVLWVLVDFASNFSSYIKELVDKVPKLCNGIRLKLDSAKKEYIELKRQLKTLTKNRVKLHSNASMNRYGSDECKGKVNALKVKIAYLMEDIAFLEAKLIQSDIKRLEILGKDRNGNRYYWMDSNGSSSAISEKNEELYNCCFLWVQGPSEADINFCLDVDVESLKKWELLAKAKGTAYATKEVFSIFRSTDGSYYQTAQGENFMIINSNGILMRPTIPAFIDKKIISETPEKLLLSHHQWAFFNDIEDIHMLVDRLDDLRENEGQLKKALTSKMDRIEVSYKQQFKIKRRIECDETFKKNHKLLKNNEFTFPELKRIETTCTSNGQHFSNMEKISKKLSRTKNDLVLEAILKDVAHLGECERALLKKQQNLIYPLNFHFEQLRTIDLEFIVETKRKRQEDILTKLLNHQRYKHISHVSGYGISSQRVDKAAHLDVQGILEEIECQFISRRREDEERN